MKKKERCKKEKKRKLMRQKICDSWRQGNSIDRMEETRNNHLLGGLNEEEGKEEERKAKE